MHDDLRAQHDAAKAKEGTSCKDPSYRLPPGLTMYSTLKRQGDLPPEEMFLFNLTRR